MPLLAGCNVYVGKEPAEAGVTGVDLAAMENIGGAWCLANGFKAYAFAHRMLGPDYGPSSAVGSQGVGSILGYGYVAAADWSDLESWRWEPGDLITFPQFRSAYRGYTFASSTGYSNDLWARYGSADRVCTTWQDMGDGPGGNYPASGAHNKPDLSLEACMTFCRGLAAEALFYHGNNFCSCYPELAACAGSWTTRTGQLYRKTDCSYGPRPGSSVSIDKTPPASAPAPPPWAAAAGCDVPPTAHGCAPFVPDWRYATSADAALDLPGIPYGSTTTLGECLGACSANSRCKQALCHNELLDGKFWQTTSSCTCYPMSLHSNVDQDGRAYENLGWVSVHCNLGSGVPEFELCRPFERGARYKWLGSQVEMSAGGVAYGALTTMGACFEACSSEPTCKQAVCNQVNAAVWSDANPCYCYPMSVASDEQDTMVDADGYDHVEHYASIHCHPEPVIPPSSRDCTQIDSRFIVNDTLLTWDDARMNCESMGGEIATAPTAEHAHIIRARADLSGAGQVWIGGVESTEVNGTWMWINGEVFSVDTPGAASACLDGSADVVFGESAIGAVVGCDGAWDVPGIAAGGQAVCNTHEGWHVCASDTETTALGMSTCAAQPAKYEALMNPRGS